VTPTQAQQVIIGGAQPLDPSANHLNGAWREQDFTVSTVSRRALSDQRAQDDRDYGNSTEREEED
jgi:hypothetical protein